jgi:hypothetical protein
MTTGVPMSRGSMHTFEKQSNLEALEALLAQAQPLRQP